MATILVVDDAAFMRMRMSKILTEAGYEVIQAENGLDALDKQDDTPHAGDPLKGTRQILVSGAPDESSRRPRTRCNGCRRVSTACLSASEAVTRTTRPSRNGESPWSCTSLRV